MLFLHGTSRIEASLAPDRGLILQTCSQRLYEIHPDLLSNRRVEQAT